MHWVAGALAVVSVMAQLGVLLPWATQAHTARQNKVSLSLSDYLSNPDPASPPTPSPTRPWAGKSIIDLNVRGLADGKVRTPTEIHHLMGRAGFTAMRVTQTDSEFVIVEASTTK